MFFSLAPLSAPGCLACSIQSREKSQGFCKLEDFIDMVLSHYHWTTVQQLLDTRQWKKETSFITANWRFHGIMLMDYTLSVAPTISYRGHHSRFWRPQRVLISAFSYPVPSVLKYLLLWNLSLYAWTPGLLALISHYIYSDGMEAYRNSLFLTMWGCWELSGLMFAFSVVC
ncbi:hypothetical protein GGR53DRAFT_294225 [Hypoxylon sp. FL1150]|nr:hypothetical protein GGR53DRAFT_294225 [Hypoxylon sp. FL1150]